MKRGLNSLKHKEAAFSGIYNLCHFWPSQTCDWFLLNLSEITCYFPSKFPKGVEI